MSWGESPAPRAILTVFRDGTRVEVGDAAGIPRKLVQLVESCSVDTTDFVEPPLLWEQVMGSPSFLHARLAPPRQLRLVAGDRLRDRAVEEILLPLPAGAWPGHVLLRAEGTTFAFAKYDPRSLRALVAEPALRLSTVPPYDSLWKLLDDALGRLDSTSRRRVGRLRPLTPARR
jgi:hypothetical protein